MERTATMKYLIKYFIDFIALIFLYAFVFFRKWRVQGRDVLLVNTLIYAYLSLVLFFTMMPIIVSIPFMLDHPYKPMNLVPFIDVSLGRGDFFRQVVLNVIMTLPFGFLFPLTRGKRAIFGVTVFFCFLMSFSIEILQPFFDRSSDITDLITNVIGGALGYFLYAIFKPVTVWALEHLKTR
ncbi:VanZ family protein [Pseudoflavonifractor sp. 60]|nr:VanZ family protein [Pseudoflavonifractor sp. 60]